MANEIVLGLVVGLAFGYVVQRGRFCMSSAFRDILLMRDFSILRAYVLAVLVQMVGVRALADLGILQVRVVPFYWLAASVGGFVFGAAIALAGGCAAGTWYRVGEGMVGSLVALIGYALGVLATAGGALSGLRQFLQQWVLTGGGENLTLPTLLGITPWRPAAVLVAAGVVWLRRPARGLHREGWGWHRTGLALGLVGIAAWVASEAAGRYYGMGITDSTGLLLLFVVDGDPQVLDWGIFFVLGIPAGAAVSALFHREIRLRAPGPGRLLQQLGGGLLMGVGATIAVGCNVGHGMTGVSVLAMSSIVSTAFVVLGVWAVTYLLFMKG